MTSRCNAHLNHSECFHCRAAQTVAHRSAYPTVRVHSLSRVAAEARMHPPVPEARLSKTTQSAYTTHCQPAEWPPSRTIVRGTGEAVSSFSPCTGSTSVAATRPGVASRYVSTWQTLTEDIQSTVAYEAIVQQAKQLLRDFESYQRSVGASLLTCDQWHATLPLGWVESAGGAVGTSETPNLDVAALGQCDAPSVAAPTEVHDCVGNVGTGQAVPPPLVSLSQLPSFTFPLDAAALELAKRRALQALYCNAQARAAYVGQELQRSRAVHPGMLKLPKVVAKGMLASGGSSSHPMSTARAVIDNQALLPAAGAGGLSRTSHASASPTFAMSAMREEERATATAEAERALSLLVTIRAMRQQAEELTVLLLHACGAWGCWSTSAANAAPASEQPDALLPSSLLPGGTRYAQHPFADLFVVAPLELTALQTPPLVSVPSVSDNLHRQYLPPLGPADVADATRLSAAGAFAKESARRRERACRKLQQALQRQQQRWSLCTTAGITAATYAATTAAPAAAGAFLEMASTPPHRAVPPPPPTSVQLDLCAAPQSALWGATGWWRGAAAQAAATSAAEGGDASLSRKVATPYGPLQQQLHTLSTQQHQLQHSCGVLHTTAVQRRHASTHSRIVEPREVQPRETITAFAEDADAGGVSHATRGTSRAASGAPSEMLAPPLPGLSSPRVSAPEALLQGPSSLTRHHSPPAPSRSSEVLAPSDTLLVSSVQLTVDRTRPWVDPPTVLEASASESPLRRTDIPCAAAATLMNADISARVARVAVQQAGPSAEEEAGSRCAKGDPGLAVLEEAHISAGNLNGSHASAGAALVNPTRVANVLCTASSSSTPLPSCSAAHVRDDVVSVLPEVCEASWHPRTNGMLSTHPAEELHALAGAERGHAARHQEECRRRRGDRGDNTTVAELKDSVRSHLSRCISRQQTGKGCGVAAPLSSPVLSPQDLTAATAQVRPKSPHSAISETAAEPPPAVVRTRKHQLHGSVASLSQSAVRMVATTTVTVDASQSDGSEELCASLQQQMGSSSPTIASVTPSRLSTAAASPELMAVKPAAQSPPHAAVADAAAFPSPTSPVQLPAGVSEGASNAAVAPPSLPPFASAAAVHPSLAPKCAPPSWSLPKAKLADGGGSAGVTKLPLRQQHRNFFSRLFSCGC